jgi:hypothetical protein
MILEVGKCYLASIPGDPRGDDIVFEVLEINGFWIRANLWRWSNQTQSHREHGEKWLNLNHVSMIESWHRPK